MCVVCGSFGKGEEGRLVPCFQCGQCYHPYCANLTISKHILKTGWRCLDCTVSLFVFCYFKLCNLISIVCKVHDEKSYKKVFDCL